MNHIIAMPATNLDSRIIKCLGLLDEQQKKAVLLVAETFARKSETSGVVYSDALVSDFNKRASELESGDVKGYSWDEVRQRSKSGS